MTLISKTCYPFYWGLMFVCSLTACRSEAQPNFYSNYKFSHRDSLLGGSRVERACFDVTHYALDIRVDPTQKTIEGSNTISFRALQNFKKIQIDLFANLSIDSILYQNEKLRYTRDEGAVFVEFANELSKDNAGKLTVFYHGQPIAAKKAPWDGGFVWEEDKAGNAWIGVACEGDGASLWYPCKDDLGDEPDSTSVSLTVPTGLTAVSNGQLRSTQTLSNGTTRFNWAVVSPINSYNITANIGAYYHFSDTYTSKIDGEKLRLDYYVLPENKEKAAKHFKQVQPMLEAYEHYLGKYPFWKDGYKLVETSFLGMEHQSCIAYGNHYLRGYLGNQPKEFNFDFIIIHESGHEYWGNALSVSDHAEMWIHESFTTYMESLYIEYLKDKAAGYRYLQSQRANIVNEEPVLGPLGVRFGSWTGSDQYYKGAWMLHSIRNTLRDDALWFKFIRTFYERYRFKPIHTMDFYTTLKEVTGRDFSLILQQYLLYPQLPTLEFAIKKKGKNSLIRYRWEAQVTGFDMPVALGDTSQYIYVNPTTTKIQEIKIKNALPPQIGINTDLFLFETREVNWDALKSE